jgi:hypothetical protein
MNRGLFALFVPVTAASWALGPDDPHLAPAALDQVLRDLAGALARVQPAGPGHRAGG